MCGIAGVITKKIKALNNIDIDLFKEMMIADAIRGEDSTGVFGVNTTGNAEFVKLSTHPFNLLNSKEYKEWSQTMWSDGRALVLHNRKATSGAINNFNTHPFSFGNVILVHNGYIDNFRGLLPIREREKHSVEVDSHAACILLARNKPEHIIPEMKGAFTFVWYDVLQKTLSFVRNEERPLFFANTDKKVYFASEPGMLQWLLDRRGIKHKIIPLAPGVLLNMALDEKELHWNFKKLPIAKRIILPPEVKSTPTKSFMERVVGKLLSHKPVEIPEVEKFNIHYGEDKIVLMDEVPFQQIVFTVDDYKAIDNTTDQWLVWGHALDSEKIEVIFNMKGTDSDVENIGYSDHLIGLISRVKNTDLNNGKGLHQEIVVTDVKPVELIATSSGKYLTEEHFNHICNKGMCECIANCQDFKPEELLIDTNGPKLSIVCQWCHQAKLDEAAKNTAVQAGK